MRHEDRSRGLPASAGPDGDADNVWRTVGGNDGEELAPVARYRDDGLSAAQQAWLDAVLGAYRRKRRERAGGANRFKQRGA